MKKRYAFIAGLAISMIFGAVHAQTLNPDSMLGNNTPAEPVPETQPKVQPSPQQPQSYELPMTAKCSAIGVVKNILEQNFGQYAWAMGYNALAPQQGSPFDGLVIVKNPINNSYTVLIISTPNNMACIIAMGTEIRLQTTENTE